MQGREDQASADSSQPSTTPSLWGGLKGMSQGDTHVMDLGVFLSPLAQIWSGDSRIWNKFKTPEEKTCTHISCGILGAGNFKITLSLRIVWNSRVKCLCGVWEGYWARLWLRQRKPQSPLQAKTVEQLQPQYGLWPQMAVAGIMRDWSHTFFHSYFRSLNENRAFPYTHIWKGKC